MGNLIYKIFTADEWQGFEAAGHFDGSPADRRDGYIHFSTVDQLSGTLEKYYAAEARVAIAAFAPDRLEAELKWEPSRGGDLFPHLYARLLMEQLDSIEWVQPQAFRRS